MPLSEDVRRELAAIEPQRDCDRLAELSGLFHTAGSLHLRGHGEFSVHLDVSESAVARRAFGLLRAFGVETGDPHVPQASVRRGDPLPAARAGRRARAEGAARCRRAVGRARAARGAAETRGRALVLPPGVPARRVPRRGLRQRAPAPHLEIRSATRAGAELVARVAAQEDVPLRVHDRGRHALAYAKGAEAIADALALAGAGDSALTIDEHAVVGRRGRTRTGSRTPTTRTSSGRAAPRTRSCRRSGRWRGKAGSERLSPTLREVAELRLRHPSVSLRELAAKCRPPVTKAAAHRRLGRLISLAGNDLRQPVAFAGPILHTPAKRVRARPPVDSDPVCRLGPERGEPEGEVVLGASPPARASCWRY